MHADYWIRIEEAIAQARINGRHVFLIVACVLVSVADGFDFSAISFAAPLLGPQLGLSPALMGSVFSLGLIGAMLGAVLSNLLTRRLTRKLVFSGSLVWFAGTSFCTALVASYDQLLAVRFLTGIGLGVPIPILMAIVGDSIPRRGRARAFGFCVSGVPLGGMLVSLVSVRLVPDWGWQSIFWVAAILPFAVLPMVVAFVREPIRNLLLRGAARGVLDRAAADAGIEAALLQQPDQGLIAARPASLQRSYVSLFTEGRAPNTIAILTSVFLAALLVYFLLSWVPSLFSKGGAAVRNGAVGGSFLNIGMVVATLSFGYLIDKFGVARVSGTGFLLAAVLVLALGGMTESQSPGHVALFFAGFFAIGSQLGSSVLVISRFPPQFQLGASSLAYITARTGALIGPLVAGLLLSCGVSVQGLFALAALVSVGASAGIFLIFILDKSNLRSTRSKAPI